MQSNLGFLSTNGHLYIGLLIISTPGPRYLLLRGGRGKREGGWKGKREGGWEEGAFSLLQFSSSPLFEPAT